MLLMISYCYNIKVEDCKWYFTWGSCRKNVKLKVVEKVVLSFLFIIIIIIIIITHTHTHTHIYIYIYIYIHALQVITLYKVTECKDKITV